MSDDAAVRAAVGDIPVPELGVVPVAHAPSLADAKVALVTTAGLTVGPRPELWHRNDSSFRELPRASRDIQLSHASPNFDRSGFAADLNVVYPIDRLEELALRGEIGSLADTHLAFMGAQHDTTFSTMLLDTGPAAARALKEQGTDVVLLTPI